MLKHLLILLTLFSCSVDRSMNRLTENEQTSLSNFESLARENTVRIGDENEPGDPLLLCLSFIDKSNGTPIPNQKVYFYHANASGEYQPADSNDETTARLNGAVVTDDLGRLFLKTTLPGDYGSSADNRHIHTTIAGANPEAYDIHFKQFTTYMGKRFVNGSDQHFLADLKKDDEDNLVAFLTIEVKFE